MIVDDWKWLEVWKFPLFLVALYYFETTWQNFGKRRHKRAPVSHLSPSILQKICNFVISEFWNKYFSFVAIFVMIDWKLGPM